MIMLKNIAFAIDNWYNAKYKGSKERGKMLIEKNKNDYIICFVN